MKFLWYKAFLCQTLLQFRLSFENMIWIISLFLYILDETFEPTKPNKNCSETLVPPRRCLFIFHVVYFGHNEQRLGMLEAAVWIIHSLSTWVIIIRD